MKMLQHRTTRWVCVFLLAAWIGQRTEAGTNTWINGTSGFWTNGANWGGGTAPGSGDTASITSKPWNVTTAIQTNIITVDGQYVAKTLLMDWAGSTHSNAGTYVCLTGAAANASLNLTNLYMAWGDGSAGSYIAVVDTLAFSNMALNVGSVSNRGVMQIGQKVTSANNFSAKGTVMALGTNASFTAYLSQLLLGFGGGSANAGQGDGTLNLLQARAVTLDVSGNVEIGGSSSGLVNYQTGALSLNNATTTVGNVYVAYSTASETQTGTTPAKNGTLILSNSIFQVATNGYVYLGGRGQNANPAWERNIAAINITAAGVSGGLDLLNTSASALNFKYPTLTNADGANNYKYNQITITLGSPGQVNGWLWGLRWTGNHVTNNTQAFSGSSQGLTRLLDATNQYARLRIITSGLPTASLTHHLNYLKTLDPSKYNTKTEGDLTAADFIVYDNGFTYVGAYVLPIPILSNTSALNLTPTSAELTGSLISTGPNATTVFVYWGPTDGSNNAPAWANTNVLGDYPSAGALATNITGLSPNTLYYYRYCGTNLYGAGWAPTTRSFKTFGPPEVNNANGASSVNRNQATLNGSLVNGTSAHLYFYLWTNSAPVTNVYDCSIWSEGVFSTNLTGLAAGMTYYYQSYATNDYGDALTTVTNFTTPGTPTWYVTASGTPGDGRSWAQAFTNIQTAIDTAADGDTLYLAAQNFYPPPSPGGNGKLIWTNKSLTILGGYAADGGSPGALSNRTTLIANSTAADTNKHRIFYMNSVTNGTLARVTVQGGQIGNQNPQALVGNVYGAGLYIANCTNLVFDSLVINGNYAFGQQSMLIYGGGLYALNSWGTITNSIIRNNWLQRQLSNSSFGGGLHLAGGAWLIQNSIIRDNQTADQTTYSDTCYGVGLYANGGTHLLKNCAISRNYGRSLTLPQGEALYLANGTLTAENCTFYWHRYEGVRQAAGTLTLKNSIIWDCGDDIVGTVALRNCNTQDGDQNGASGNISTNPIFERGLYLATNSPCINAGNTNAADIGLSSRTTRADGQSDTGTVDLGYHFASAVTDLYVSVNTGSDTNTGLTSDAPYKTIRKAFSVARDGTHINLAAGLYNTNSETFQLSFPGNIYGVQLLGTNAAETIIDARLRSTRLLYMANNYPDARLSGVTLTGADMQQADSVTGIGAGLYVAHSQVLVDGCIISNNTLRSLSVVWGSAYGAGLYLANSFVSLSNSVVAKNNTLSAPYGGAAGGGIYWTLTDGIMDACTITGNRAQSGSLNSPGNPNSGSLGGGAYFTTDASGLSIRNSLIANNNATDGFLTGLGSGLYNASVVALVNCTLTTNRATGLYAASTASLTNCIVWNNGIDVTGTVRAAYSDIGTGPYTDGGNNLSTNPGFIGPITDFRLSLGSPCVNAGTNLSWMNSTLDLDGNPRINNSLVDLGAYEQITPVRIVNQNVSNLTAFTASMNASLQSTAGATTYVWLYWGSSNGTTNKNSWPHVVDMGTRSVGNIVTNITFDNTASTYYYTYYASNTLGQESWAEPPQSFTIESVTVTASDDSAAESGQDPGTFALTRDIASTSNPWTVNYTLGGTATLGTDYQCATPSSATIEAGATQTVISITPIIDRLNEGAETITVTLNPGGYLIGAPSTATLTITDWIAPQTVFVNTGGNGTYATNWSSAFSNIQHAIDAAQDGDTLYLAAQTFTLPTGTGGLGKLVWTNKTLSLLGGCDTNSGTPGTLSALPTTLYNSSGYAGNTNRILYISGVSNGTLSHLKLLGGKIGYSSYSTAPSFVFCGAGLYLANCTNMLLDSLVLDYNSIAGQQNGSAHGAGLYATNSWGTLTNSLTRNNTLSIGLNTLLRGAGLYLSKGGWTLRDTLIRDNTANSAGAGIGLFVDQGTHTLRNCAITRNVAPATSQGDALYGASATITAENCTFYWHRSEGMRNNAGTITLRNSIVRECGDDIAGTIILQNCNTQDGDQSGSNGNQASDPLLERGLYLAPNSPCIDAGSTTASGAGLSGRTTSATGQPDTGTVDMGYHFSAGVTDLYVSVNSGSDNNAGTNAAAPFKTIRKAFSVAGNGTHINLAAGQYTTNSETFPFSVANFYGVQLIGANTDQTVINLAGANARALTMNYNYPDAGIKNLTIANANWAAPLTGWGSPGTLGFDLYLTHFDGQLTGCVFSNSVIPRYGGGLGGGGYPAGAIYAASANLILSNCVSTRHSTLSGYAEGYYAAGLFLSDVNALLVNCTISANQTTGATEPNWGFGYGSGLYLNGIGTVRNCLITGNSGSGVQNIHGQGLYVDGGTWRFENCTIASNSTEGLYRYAGTVSVTNSILWGNGTDVLGTVLAAYSDIGTGSYTDGGNNLSIYPLFATNPASFKVVKAGPCWNAGIYQSWMANATDLDGHPRHIGPAPDMGCYEVQPELNGTLFKLR